MEIKKFFDEVTDPGIKGLMTLVLSEWMSKLSREQEKENPKKYKLVNERFQNWEDILKEKYPELKEESQKFLDWLVGYYGEELESYYLLGICDGIRILKWMIKL